MAHITKRFGGVLALADVSLDCEAGEIHALCGENGAGKSTLMGILAGSITDYQGQLCLGGRNVRFSSPRAAGFAGIRIIHQEPTLVPSLSVAANILLGREPTTSLRLLDNRAARREAQALLDRLSASFGAGEIVGRLRLGDQQLVEIARALAWRTKILILDEPTSALSPKESDRLLQLMKDLRNSGTCILYVSHRIKEIFDVSDRITVLRDGRHVVTAETSKSHPGQLIRWMVGQDRAPSAPAQDSRHSRGVVLLDVVNLSVRRGRSDRNRVPLSDITFQLHHGEILGVAGLLGAGRTELLEALFGASPARPSGVVRLDGRRVSLGDPRGAIRAGIALVPEDRKQLALFAPMSVGQNITISHLGSMARAGVIARRAERQAVAHAITRHRIKTPGPGSPVTSLSGGNQQKSILARWLLAAPRVLLLDEPTRGIDVGSKSEIYSLIRELAYHEGLGILMSSSELPELLGICDRILVLCQGRLSAVFTRDEATEERILLAASPGAPEVVSPEERARPGRS